MLHGEGVDCTISTEPLLSYMVRVSTVPSQHLLTAELHGEGVDCGMWRPHTAVSVAKVITLTPWGESVK